MSFTKTLVAISCAAFVALLAASNSEESTDGEIKLGTIVSSDEAVAAQEIAARVYKAYVKKTNDEGGISGRMVKIFSYDDGGDSKTTLDLARKLVEVDRVAFLFNIGNRASDVIAPYVRFKKIPQMSDSGLGEQMAPGRQAEILGSYISRHLPKATIAILSEPDYVGAQFLTGFGDGLGLEHARLAITNMDDIHPAGGNVNRVARVSGSSSDVLAIFGKSHSELELLREMTELKWRPLVVMNDAAQILELSQVDASAGIISLSNHVRNHLWTPPELAEWDNFRKSYLLDREPDSSTARYYYLLARSMVLLLQRVGGEITSKRLTDSYDRMQGEAPTLLDRRTIDLVRFNGKTWDVLESGVQ